jgi:hypothetical protein
MAKALAGVKYGKMTSQRGSDRPHTKGASKGSGRSGPPMVDIGSKSSSSSNMKARPNTKFARLGSISTRKGSTGEPNPPTIGSQSNRKGGVGPFK